MGAGRLRETRLEKQHLWRDEKPSGGPHETHNLPVPHQGEDKVCEPKRSQLNGKEDTRAVSPSFPWLQR